MSNGNWTAVGLQTGLPAGNAQSLGPFTFEFSDAQTIQTYVFAAGVNLINMPTTGQANGLWIFPPVGSAVTLLLQGSPTDVGIFLNPNGPTFINFDQGNYPTSVIITASGTVIVAAQFT